MHPSFKLDVYFLGGKVVVVVVPPKIDEMHVNPAKLLQGDALTKYFISA